MLFSSITFLYYFLPLTAAIYFAVPKGFKNAVLLLASFVFYGWGEPKYVVLMGLSILSVWAAGGKVQAKKSRKDSMHMFCLHESFFFAVLQVCRFFYLEF